MSDGTPPPADDLFEYRPSGVPGGRAPHVWTGEGRGIGDSFYDRFGPGFTVLRLGPKPPQADALLAAFAKRNVPVRTIDVPSPVARDLYERDIVVVRPDQHVAWRGNADPPDAETVVAQVTGNRSSQQSRNNGGRTRDEEDFPLFVAVAAVQLVRMRVAGFGAELSVAAHSRHRSVRSLRRDGRGDADRRQEGV